MAGIGAFFIAGIASAFIYAKDYKPGTVRIHREAGGQHTGGDDRLRRLRNNTANSASAECKTAAPLPARRSAANACGVRYISFFIFFEWCLACFAFFIPAPFVEAPGALFGSTVLALAA